jgi:outer membrane protein OmpA-like peptidoglycan-associated protein
MRISSLSIIILLLLGCLTTRLQAQEGDAIDFTNVRVLITNETTINSEALEYSPAFYEDGIVFISSKVPNSKYKIKDVRSGKNIMSIFIARRSGEGVLRSPEPFAEELLSNVNEGPLTFNRTNQGIFFTRNNIKNGKKIKADDGIVKLKVYTTDKVGGNSWGEVIELPFNDDNSNTMHPAISVDGDKMYFASDRPGGFGGMDIYVVERIDGVWGRPENLGAQINTSSDEVFPFIHADGTLFFASSGHRGEGGLDVFFAYPEGADEEDWSAPVNFEPLNSGDDDFGLIIDRDKKNGYFSSNRGGGLGEDDIYSFYIVGDLDEASNRDKEVARPVNVLVQDGQTGSALSQVVVKSMPLDEFTLAKAIVADETGSQVDQNLLLRIPFDESSKTGYTNSNGEYSTSLLPGNHIFKIEKPGYQTKRVLFNLEEDTEEGLLTVSLDEPKPEEPETAQEEVIEAPDFLLDQFDNLPSKIEEGTVFQLSNIYYNFNDASIRPDARRDLDVLAELLEKYPDIEIELSSHTDSRGTREYNRELSQRRAENAVAYLVDQGISRRRLTPAGYGESQLRNNCYDGVACTEEQQQYNRRTEVKITRMSGSINLSVEQDDSPPETVDDSGRETRRPVSKPATAGAEGRYWVVAGAFRNYDYAQSRLDELVGFGFSGAQIEYLESRKLYSVVAGKYPTKSGASSAVEKLRNNHGINSFMKRK